MITLIHRTNHFDFLLPPLYAERALSMGSTQVAWVSAKPWAEDEANL